MAEFVQTYHLYRFLIHFVRNTQTVVGVYIISERAADFQAGQDSNLSLARVTALSSCPHSRTRVKKKKLTSNKLTKHKHTNTKSRDHYRVQLKDIPFVLIAFLKSHNTAVCGRGSHRPGGKEVSERNRSVGECLPKEDSKKLIEELEKELATLQIHHQHLARELQMSQDSHFGKPFDKEFDDRFRVLWTDPFNCRMCRYIDAYKKGLEWDIVKQVAKYTEVQNEIIEDCDGIDEDLDTTCHFSESELEVSSSLSGQFNQEEFNYLIMELNLPKVCSVILASRLNKKNILSPGTKITYYCHREEGLIHYFSQQEGLVFCNDIGGLLLEMGVPQYRPEDWHLFKLDIQQSLRRGMKIFK
ncbi:hypothetical protein LOD99_11178, partial [Oopsacas minuta]